MHVTYHLPLSETAERKLFGGLPRSGTRFRKLLAAISTSSGLGLPPTFFGYGPDGRPNDRGETVIVIGANARGLRLTAIGTSACLLLQDHAGPIRSALMEIVQEPIRMFTASGEHDMAFLPFGRRMIIRDLCVGKNTPDNYWYGAAQAARGGRDWMDLGQRKIPNYLVQSLMNQALLLDEEGDEVGDAMGAIIGKCTQINGSWSLAHTELKNRLKIRLLSVGGQSWIKRDHGCSLVRLHDVVFSIQAILKGPWFAGRMKIEGRGEFLDARPQECGQCPSECSSECLGERSLAHQERTSVSPILTKEDLA